MAKPTLKIADLPKSQEQTRAELLTDLEQMLVHHEEGLAALLELADELHEKGLLDMATAAIKRGDRLLEIFVQIAEEPGGMRMIKNGIALVQGLSNLDTESLGRMFQLIGAGMQGMRADQSPQVTGAWSLLSAMKDPEVSQGLSMALGFLKALGKAAAEQKVE